MPYAGEETQTNILPYILTMSGKFEPKVPVQLNPPKDDLISVEDLAKANGKTSLTNPAVKMLFSDHKRTDHISDFRC